MCLRKNGRSLRIVLHSVLANAAATYVIRETKLRKRYFDCFRCTQRGVSVNRSLVCSMNKKVAKSDNEFRSQKQKDHPNNSSKFDVFQIGRINSLHYMHADFLGLMKRLKNLWHRGGVYKSLPIGSINLQIADDRLSNMRQFPRYELPLKRLPLSEAESGKAFGFCQFLIPMAICP